MPDVPPLSKGSSSSHPVGTVIQKLAGAKLCLARVLLDVVAYPVEFIGVSDDVVVAFLLPKLAGSADEGVDTSGDPAFDGKENILEGMAFEGQ